MVLLCRRINFSVGLVVVEVQTNMSATPKPRDFFDLSFILSLYLFFSVRFSLALQSVVCAGSSWVARTEAEVAAVPVAANGRFGDARKGCCIAAVSRGKPGSEHDSPNTIVRKL